MRMCICLTNQCEIDVMMLTPVCMQLGCTVRNLWWSLLLHCISTFPRQPSVVRDLFAPIKGALVLP